MNPTLARVLLLMALPAFYLVPRITGPGWGAVVGALTVIVASGYLVRVSLRATLGENEPLAPRGLSAFLLRRWHVPDRAPARDIGPYEGPDPVGDNYRVVTGVTQASGFGILTLISLVLMVVGDQQMKGLAILGLLTGLFMTISMGTLARNAIGRIERGRGLVRGDPLRHEGVDPRNDDE